MYRSHDLAVLIPVLRRPHRVAPLLESLHSTVPDAHILFLCSPGDTAEHDAIHDVDAEAYVMPTGPGRGDYATKINTGYRETKEPLLFLGADDLLFHPGWFEAATCRLDGTVGVVGTNDLTNRRTYEGDHSTHSLVTRTYVDRYGTIDEPGKILCERYAHEFCDDELVGTAKHRGMYAHAHDAHVEHLHPMASKAPMDPLYAQQAARMRVSRQLYLRRQRLWT